MDAQADGDGAGMHPNFDMPIPAEFAASDNESLDMYAQGWTHGWDDATAASESESDGLNPARGLINGFLLASIFWIVAGLFAVSCHAQQPATAAGVGPFNYGYVTDSARVQLEQAWDTRNAFQTERGFCIEPADVEVDTSTDKANVAWRVHHVHPPTSVTNATPYMIQFDCSPTAIASIHVHTPTTCAHDQSDPYGFHPKVCILGGDDSALCSVDETDRMAARGDEFTAVQCDKRAFVFYWPGRRG